LLVTTLLAATALLAATIAVRVAIQVVRASESSSNEAVRGQKHTLIKRCSQAASAITA
jgi:hypothetical protein